MNDNFCLLHILAFCSKQIACSLAASLFQGNKYLYAHHLSPRILLRCLFTEKHSELGSVVHAYNPNPWETETRRSVWTYRQMVYIASTGQPGLYTDNAPQTNKQISKMKRTEESIVCYCKKGACFFFFFFFLAAQTSKITHRNCVN